MAERKERHDGIWYIGNRTDRGVFVSIDGPGMVFADRLDPRFDLVNHSPDGFEFGYGGSGPAQLALAILADATDDETALAHYQRFKSEHVATWSEARFAITAGDVRAAVA